MNGSLDFQPDNEASTAFPCGGKHRFGGFFTKEQPVGDLGLCVVFSVLSWLLFLPRQPGLSGEAQHMLSSPTEMLDPVLKLKI